MIQDKKIFLDIDAFSTDPNEAWQELTPDEALRVRDDNTVALRIQAFTVKGISYWLQEDGTFTPEQFNQDDFDFQHTDTQKRLFHLCRYDGEADKLVELSHHKNIAVFLSIRIGVNVVPAIYMDDCWEVALN